MASVAAALQRIKQDLHDHLSPRMIESACRRAGHRWRERKLGPVETIRLFVLQVLHCNTAIRHLRHLIKSPLNAAAYCRARMRLPLVVLQQLLRESSAALRQELAHERINRLGNHRDDDQNGAKEDPTCWRGHTTYLTDGSASITPDTPPLRKAFGQPSGRDPGCGLPVPKVLGLFDALTGLIVEVMAFALFVHEHSKVWLLHPLLQAGDLLVGDRGLCSYAHLALLAERGVLALFRLHQGQIVDFRPHRKAYDRRRGPRARAAQKGRPRSRFVRRLGKHDQVVAWLKPKWNDGPRSWMSRKQFDTLPEELLVREVRYRVPHKGYRTREVTVVTTLLDETLYPKEAIAELYGIRWRVETHWRELKTTLKMRRLKCRTEAGIKKELAVYALAYNLVHAVMVRAAARQRTTPDRISFSDALRWLLSAAPGEALADLVINPLRPGRFEPRVIKDYFDTYPRMTRPRRQFRVRLRSRKR
jgi:hypothetical protein